MSGEARRARRTSVVFAMLAMTLCALVVANLSLGSLPVPAGDLVRVLASPDASDVFSQVIWSIRLPRLIAAGFLGAALSLSGLLLQIFFNNPIAGPFVLGISQGAKLAVAILMIVVIGTTGVMASWMPVVAATIGSALVMALVLILSRRIGSTALVTVAGVMVGYLANAATDMLVTFASDANVVNLRNWSLGSFSGTSWTDVAWIVTIVVLASACVFALSKPLGAYLLGASYATSVGVNVRAFRRVLIVLSSTLSAVAVAFAGPISFVGIAVPHIVRRLLATSRPLLVVPASFLGGAVFCLAADLIARTAFAPTEVTVSTITALLGAPVVIAVLMDRRRGRD